MAEQITPRFGFRLQTEGSDPFPGRAGFMEILEQIEAGAAQFDQGLYADRGPAGQEGRLYVCTDSGVDDYHRGVVFYDTGAAWVQLGGLTLNNHPQDVPVRLGHVSSENPLDLIGIKPRAARADHVHPYSLGYMLHRFALQWGSYVGPGWTRDGSAGGHSDPLDHDGNMDLARWGQLDMVAKRAGMYRIQAGIRLAGFTLAESSWKENPMDLGILVNETPRFQRPIPTIVDGVRAQEVSWVARLAVGDAVASDVYLRTNIGTESGVVTDGSIWVYAEMI